jgi:hypothetical protein
VEEQPEMVNDTVVVETGTYKFFKKNAHASYYADKFTGQGLPVGSDSIIINTLLPIKNCPLVQR